jgi:hypothetical protein
VVSIPALARQAEVTVTFDDGRGTEAVATVASAPEYARTGVIWHGGAGLHLRALEFGARLGEPGDVWAEAPRSPDYGVNGKGGFLTRLGRADMANPILAEVYSIPTGRMKRDGTVRLSIEAEVTDLSCGKVVSGKTFELGGDEPGRSIALDLTMPQCDALGGYLELKNLLQDMKIARN